jgi:hypothetical protein
VRSAIRANQFSLFHCTSNRGGRTHFEERLLAWQSGSRALPIIYSDAKMSQRLGRTFGDGVAARENPRPEENEPSPR